MKTTRLKARKGAFVIITALIMTSMAAMVALAIDFARLSSLKNELQTSADAAAWGGGLLLSSSFYPLDTARARDSAYSYGHRNQAMQDTVRVDSIIFGDWDDVAHTFTPGGTPIDAVRTVVSRQSNGLFMQGFGVSMPRIKARATAWSAAPVLSYGCIKPWAMPYPQLRHRINQYRGVPDSTANLTRAFSAQDLADLLAMPASARQFDLHLPSGNTSNLDSLNVSMAGNYQAVKLPKYWDVITQTKTSPAATGNAQEYRDNVSGATCHGVNIGDSLETHTGLAGPMNTVDPLVIQGNPSVGICSTIAGYTDNTIHPGDPTYGDCRTNGVAPTVIAMYYLCTSACSGNSYVTVMMIGAFTLDKVYSNNSNNPPTDMAEIKGTFAALSGSGRAGGGSATSPVTIVILVQ